MFAWRRQALPLLYTQCLHAGIVVGGLASAMRTSPCLRHAHLTLPPPCSPHLASAMLTSPCLRHAHLTLPPPCSPHLAITACFFTYSSVFWNAAGHAGRQGFD